MFLSVAVAYRQGTICISWLAVADEENSAGISLKTTDPLEATLRFKIMLFHFCVISSAAPQKTHV